MIRRRLEHCVAGRAFMYWRHVSGPVGGVNPTPLQGHGADTRVDRRRRRGLPDP